MPTPESLGRLIALLVGSALWLGLLAIRCGWDIAILSTVLLLGLGLWIGSLCKFI
jgi:hypothetical protein